MSHYGLLVDFEAITLPLRFACAAFALYSAACGSPGARNNMGDYTRLRTQHLTAAQR
jgi:hypothetical protein